MRAMTHAEYHIVESQAGYQRRIEVKAYITNPDGTERTRTVASIDIHAALGESELASKVRAAIDASRLCIEAGCDNIDTEYAAALEVKP